MLMSARFNFSCFKRIQHRTAGLLHMHAASKFARRGQLAHFNKAIGQIGNTQLGKIKLAKAWRICHVAAAYIDQLNMPRRMLAASKLVADLIGF